MNENNFSSYHFPVVLSPVENKWLCDENEEKKSKGKRKHEVDVHSHAVTSQAPGIQT